MKIDDLRVTFLTNEERVQAVNGVSLSMSRGQTLGLVGETGAGKTTTALSILRLLPQRVSRMECRGLYLDGQDLTKLSEEEMRLIRGCKISMIFQDPMSSLNPNMTVGLQIREVLEAHRPDMDKKSVSARVDELLSLVGIQPARQKEYPHQFSGGMKQRVVIAIALACEPDLLIADEPTTALDVTIQAQVLNMMDGLKDKLGTSMLLITHDLGVVARCCDAVAIMYAGEIIEYGTVRDIFENPRRHPYTVGLFGSIPDLTAPRSRLSPISGLMPDPTDLPSGCRFHPRCPRRMPVCSVEVPPVALSGGHQIKCHLFSDNREPADQ